MLNLEDNNQNQNIEESSDTIAITGSDELASSTSNENNPVNLMLFERSVTFTKNHAKKTASFSLEDNQYQFYYSDDQEFDRTITELNLQFQASGDNTEESILFKNNVCNTKAVSLLESIMRHKLETGLALFSAVSHGFATALLMSKATDTLGELSEGGDGIWSPDPASDWVGIGSRATGAVLPLALLLLNNHVDDNKNHYGESAYNARKATLVAGDLVALAATFGETYAFNRGGLNEDDIYRFGSLFEGDNAEKVFLNKFSGWFLPGQLITLTKDLTWIVKYSFGLNENQTVNSLTNVANHALPFMVAGAFGNIERGIVSGELPNNDVLKNTVGIAAAATGACVAIAAQMPKYSKAVIKTLGLNQCQTANVSYNNFDNDNNLDIQSLDDSRESQESQEFQESQAAQAAQEPQESQAPQAQQNERLSTIIEVDEESSDTQSVSILVQ